MSVHTLPDPSPGSTLHEAAAAAYQVAQLTGCTVRVMFNDFPLTVTPQDAGGQAAMNAYWKARGGAI